MELSFSKEHTTKVKEFSTNLQLLSSEISRVIVGHKNIIEFIVMALLCDGHILLEGVPGVAKTTMVKTLTQAVNLSFKRIQFTPDLLPADLVGTLMYNQKTNEFETKKGPIFANLVLADEINRAPAKAQSALLEAMQERQVTIGSTTFILDSPFLVFATQNPIEQEGTYRLPEAQVDRFMFKLTVGYPEQHEERDILKRVFDTTTVTPILDKELLFQAQDAVKNIYLNEQIIEYIVSIVLATRDPKKYELSELQDIIRYGASPRATIALHHAARAHALLKGRHFVTPEDVTIICHAVLRHRIALSYHAEAENINTDTVIDTILKTLPSP